ncbi:DoxX family protein [Flavobacterium sp. RHBU_3]|uniref:DoxX family protein n=1 Tax=Flavobacterium sp. RHBU_3 TaxID=3391184 RepID=UPI003984E768
MWIFKSTINKNLNSFALLLVRVVAGGLMLTHGIMKYKMLMGPGPVKFADPIGIGENLTLALAVFAELVCSALIILGFATRLAALPPIVTMVVAVFVVHAHQGLEQQELPILYLLIYIVVLITGSGKYSIDRIIPRKKRYIFS